MGPHVTTDTARPAPRRTRIDTRPWRTSVTAGLALTGLLAVGVLGFDAVTILRESKEGRSGINRPLKPPLRLPPSAPSLLVVRDATMQISGIVVATPAHGVIPASLTIVPVSAQISNADGTKAALVAADTGPGALADAAAGLLGVEFVGIYDVERSVLDEGQNLEGKQSVDELVQRSEGSTELARLGKVEAAWSSLLAKPRASAPPASAAGVLAAITVGKAPTIRSLTGNAAGPSLVELDQSVLFLTMAETAPGAVSPATSLIRFEIRDPFRDRAVRQELIARLAIVGASVIWVREVADEPTLETQIAFDNPGRQAEVEQYGPIVGKVLIGLTDQPVDNVDASLTIGRDFVESARTEIAKRAATTTTVAPITTRGGNS